MESVLQHALMMAQNTTNGYAHDRYAVCTQTQPGLPLQVIPMLMDAKQFQLPAISSAERRYQLAKSGERVASEHLNSLGYSIIGQNVRVGAWEIDLICQFNNEIIFVEVKTTGANYRPEDRVSNSQQKRLFQAAERWMVKSRLESQPARFDLVVVEFNAQTGDCRIDHHIDALRRDDTRSADR